MIEHRFKTFLPPKKQTVEPFNLMRMMILCTNKYGMSREEFWASPPFIIFELLGMFQKPEEGPMTRKEMVDIERRLNMGLPPL